MGIGGENNNLWSYINPYERIVRLSEIASVIGNDADKPRVAVDAAYALEACLSMVWVQIVGNSGKKDNISVSEKKGNIENFNMEYMIKKTQEFMIAKNNSLLGARMYPIWCMDGDRNSEKLATQTRINKSSPLFKSLMLSYIKAKKLSKEGSTSRSHLDKYNAIEMAYYRLDESEKEENVYVDPTKETFEEHFKYVTDLLPAVKIKCKGFNEKVYEIFKTYEGFKNNVIRVPKISEGERLCSLLTQIGFCEAVHANDSDTMICGAKYVFFKKIFTKNTNPKFNNALSENKNDPWYSLYSYQEVLTNLGITPSGMLYLGIRMGNDFNDRIGNDKFDSILKEARQNTISGNYDDIYELNTIHCGRLKPDICVDHFSVTKELKKEVIEAVKKLF